MDINDDIQEKPVDSSFLVRWRHLKWIFRDPRKLSKKKNIVFPQVIIDGVPVGSFIELLALEEDNDLGKKVVLF